MKKWNAPEIAELNIAETENGFLPADFETVILFKDDTVKPNGSGNGDKEDDSVNALS